MKSNIISILVIITSLSGNLFAKTVTLTDTGGRDIEVELASADENEVSFIRNDGRKYTVAMDTLSADSQSLVVSWFQRRTELGPLVKSDRNLVVSMAYNKEKQTTRYKDEELIHYQPSVQISNNDLKNKFRAVKGTLFIIGRSVETPSLRRTLNKQSFVVDLPRKSQKTWTAEAFQVVSNTSKFGYGYEVDGYILILQNYEDDIIYEHASKAEWARPSGKALSLEEYYDYDETLSTKINSASL